MRTTRLTAFLLTALGLAIAAVVTATTPATAATITSTVTIAASSGSAPPGWSYPNATIVVSGVAKPSNASNPRSVSLWRRVSSSTVYEKVAAQTSAGSGAYSFSTQLPRNEAWAIFTVRVDKRTAGNGDAWSYIGSTGVQVTQTAGPESLTTSIVSPKIVETTDRSGPEAAADAAQLGRVTWVTGGATRTINLQERNLGKYGDSYWHDLAESTSVAAGSSGTWFPSTPLWSSSQYRSIYHYSTGIDTASAPITGFDVPAEFSDEFGGDLSQWHQRNNAGQPNHGQGFEVHDMSTVTTNGQVATLTPRPRRTGDPTCSGVLAGEATPHGQTCLVTPHIVTNTALDAPRSDTESVWIAARMKLQSGASGQGGPHSSFWTTGGYCAGGEVDVVEYMGDLRFPNRPGGKGAIGHNLYYDDGLESCDSDVKVLAATEETGIPAAGAGETWSANYHIYALRWQQPVAAGAPSTYTFFVDGTKVAAHVGPHAGAKTGLILSNLVNDYENYGQTSVSGPVSLRVDWVRAWRY